MAVPHANVDFVSRVKTRLHIHSVNLCVALRIGVICPRAVTGRVRRRVMGIIQLKAIVKQRNSMQKRNRH